MDKTQQGPVTAGPLIERIMIPVVRLGGIISSISILTLLGVTGYSIFMRYVLNQPLVWADQFLGYMLVVAVMSGTTEAYRRGNHIAIDMIADQLRGRWNTLRWLWSDLCVLMLAVVIAISTWEAIAFARLFGSYSAGAIEIQTWIPQIPVLIGSILLGLFALARLIGRLTRQV
ncbi:MAG: TRAP transporter small permease [Thiothrix sp.]|nr:TRAP transporter small permease [Thiothrix sp.]